MGVASRGGRIRCGRKDARVIKYALLWEAHAYNTRTCPVSILGSYQNGPQCKKQDHHQVSHTDSITNSTESKIYELARYKLCRVFEYVICD